MLKRLDIAGLGPAASFEVNFADRLNLVTGDNGLGKSFLLDVAWWVCARDWPEEPVVPLAPMRATAPRAQTEAGPAPSIEATIKGASTRDSKYGYHFSPARMLWERDGPGRPTVPGLVLYARVDGGFSVWDPARHYFKHSVKFGISDPERPPAFHFSREEVWKGLRDDAGNTVSRGLLVDWNDWQTTDAPAFTALRQVLEGLSPSPDEPIRIAREPVRLPGPSVDRIPALEMPYGIVPVTLASAGFRRIVALAYLIVWMWIEHKAAAIANGMEPQRRLIILIDEIEAHLHPQWQRRILPAILDVARFLESEADLKVQFIVSTHAPLVMASVEPCFEEAHDRLFHLKLREGRAVLEQLPWSQRGDVTAWLTSEVFGLGEARSVPAENAIADARALMEGAQVGDPAVLEQRLATLLSARDPFWAEWYRYKMVSGRS